MTPGATNKALANVHTPALLIWMFKRYQGPTMGQTFYRGIKDTKETMMYKMPITGKLQFKAYFLSMSEVTAEVPPVC